GAASGLLHGPGDAGREEERQADGRRDGAGAGGRPAPVPAALRGQRALVGSGSAGQGVRDRPAGGDAHGADCRLDSTTRGFPRRGVTRWASRASTAASSASRTTAKW